MKLFKPDAPDTNPLIRLVPDSTDYSGGEGYGLRSNWQIWKGLIWCEWFSHSYLLLTFLGIWLLGVWVLPLAAHPGWILLVAALFAMLAGPAYGGGDVIEGAEEFTLALPATRGERYLARLTVGGGATLFFSALDLACLQLDWSQAIGSFFLDTRILSVSELAQPGLVYGFSMTLPFTLFSTSFVIAAIAHSRILALSSWFVGGMAALIWTQVGNWYENWVWGEIRGWFTAFVCLLWSGMCLFFGYYRYVNKEVGPESQPTPIPGKFWLWLAVSAVGFLIFLAMVAVFLKKLDRWISG